MAYYQRGNRGGAGRSGKPNNKITGMFASKNPDLFTGTVDGEYLDKLIEKIKAAKTAGQGIVFFLWTNAFKKGPRDAEFNLSVDVSQPLSERPAAAPAAPAPGRKPIAPDPNDPFA